MPEQAQLAYTRATLAAPPGDDGPIEFVASQARANRYGFALRPEGWRLDNFARNPVMLWMHNPMQPPIGRMQAERVGGELRARVLEFDQGDELARTVERKFRGGFLNAVSVGWGFVDKQGAPIKNWWSLSADEIAGPEVFYDLEEISAVTVPGDPRAVRKQSQQALARLGRELLDLVGDPDDPTDLAGRVQAEVSRQLDGFLAAALQRLAAGDLTAAALAAGAGGVALTNTTNGPAATATPAPDPEPAPPAPDPAASAQADPPAEPAPAAAAAFTPAAAETFLAAFAPKEG